MGDRIPLLRYLLGILRLLDRLLVLRLGRGRRVLRLTGLRVGRGGLGWSWRGSSTGLACSATALPGDTHHFIVSLLGLSQLRIGFLNCLSPIFLLKGLPLGFLFLHLVLSLFVDVPGLLEFLHGGLLLRSHLGCPLSCYCSLVCLLPSFLESRIVFEGLATGLLTLILLLRGLLPVLLLWIRVLLPILLLWIRVLLPILLPVLLLWIRVLLPILLPVLLLLGCLLCLVLLRRILLRLVLLLGPGGLFLAGTQSPLGFCRSARNRRTRLGLYGSGLIVRVSLIGSLVTLPVT